MSVEDSVISLRNIAHTYSLGGADLPILRDVSLNIDRGESCAIVGASGSGKSTLLNILGLLDRQTSGSYLLNGQNTADLNDDQRAAFRNNYIGFVFQAFHLLPRLNTVDNVALPLLYRGLKRNEARQEAKEQLEKVGLADRLQHYPADLSGGQRQRVAIARALVGKPSLVLADEPTGNLDSDTAQSILSLLLKLNSDDHVTLILVTHDDSLARQLGRYIKVASGALIEDTSEQTDERRYLR